MDSYKYKIEGLDCANCAMKVEEAINKLFEVESASLNFAAKTLIVKSSAEPNELISILRKTIDKVEEGVLLTDYNNKMNHEHNHEHCHDHCSEHEHNHEHCHDHCSEHEHNHEHCHDHCSEHKHHKETSEDFVGNYKYVIEGLDCANCAIKVEEAINRLSEVENASLNFAAKTLTIKSSAKSDELIMLLKKTIDKVEDGVIISEINKNGKIKKEKKKISKMMVSIIETMVAVLFLAVGLILKLFDIPEWISMLFMGISAVIAGYRVVIKGVKAIIRLNFNENVLMSIAVIAALCIGEFFEAAMVTILFSIGEMLEDKAVNTSRRDIEKLSQIRPDTAHIITSDGIETVDAEGVESGANIQVNPYERIPIDGILYDGVSTIDTSALTGESLPRNVQNGDSVMSGMMNLNGVLKIRTTKTCENSAAARILKLVEESSAQKGKSENFITRFAKVYTPIIFVLAVLLCTVPPLIGAGGFFDWLNRSLVFLVASCPCALVISVPLGFYSGIGACSKAGVLVKGGKYIEVISKADSIAFDKTGTLTNGELKVTKIIANNGYSEEDIITLAAASEQYSTHPAALAIKKRAENLKLPIISNNEEKAGYGVSAIFEGKKVLCGNKKLFQNESLESGVIYLSVDGNMAGKIYVEDTVRDDTKEIIKNLSSFGFKHIVMLTGDSEKNAARIAEECGLTEYKASLLPEDKTEEVEKLQKNSKVIFVGDGINDAPVLAKSDCGFAMGLGSEAAIESADAVLVNGMLSKLPKAVKLSRRIMSTVKFNIIFALAVKIIILALAVVGIAPMWLAVFADTGVSLITVLNSARLLHSKKA